MHVLRIRATAHTQRWRSSHSPGSSERDHYDCEDGLMIKKVKGGYRVLSSKGKNMGGPYKTREEALKRLRQVEFFKRQKS
jgi:hypothetical protein